MQRLLPVLVFAAGLVAWPALVEGEELAQARLAAAPARVAPDPWEESVRAERERDFLRSAALRKQLAAQRPEDAHLHWRIARDLLRAGEDASAASPERAIALFEEARRFAQRGSEIDPGCGECCLYEFGGTARIATTGGILSSLGEVRKLGPLADRCLADPPTWRDDEFRNEEANLYFGMAQYFRLLPDSAVVKAIVGRRRDLPRATALARRAVAMTPARVDYRVELGTLLLCSGDVSGDAALLAEGRDVLRSVETLPDLLRTDAQDRARARRLIEAPGEACLSGRNVKTG